MLLILLIPYLHIKVLGFTKAGKSYLNKFTYVSETIDLITENNPNLEITVNGSVNTNVPGVYPISYLAEYSLNNRVHTAYTKLIVVVEG